MHEKIQVFRIGITWKYAIEGVVSPEDFESRDEALFAAEKALESTTKKPVAKDIVEEKPAANSADQVHEHEEQFVEEEDIEDKKPFGKK